MVFSFVSSDGCSICCAIGSCTVEDSTDSFSVSIAVSATFSVGSRVTVSVSASSTSFDTTMLSMFAISSFIICSADSLIGSTTIGSIGSITVSFVLTFRAAFFMASVKPVAATFGILLSFCTFFSSETLALAEGILILADTFMLEEILL